MFSFVSIPDDIAEAIPVAGTDGFRLALYHLRASRRDGPVLLVGHACGFAAGAYLPLLQRLAEHADVFAFDARGHGGSDSRPEPLSLYSIDPYALDLSTIGRAVTARTNGRPIHFAGHSLNAAAMLRLGSLYRTEFDTSPWRSVVAFEPPIFPTSDTPGYAELITQDNKTIAGAKRRRRDWVSPQAFAEALTGRSVFRGIGPDYMLAYANSVLRPVNDGYTLACTPEIEAATFENCSTDTTFRALPDFPADVSVHIVGGDPAEPTKAWMTVFAPEMARRAGWGTQPRRNFTTIAGCGHLMVQQDPQTTFAIIRDSLASD